MNENDRENIRKGLKTAEFDPEFNYTLIFYWKDGTHSTANTRYEPEDRHDPIISMGDRRITRLIRDYPDQALSWINETRELDHVEIVSNLE